MRPSSVLCANSKYVRINSKYVRIFTFHDFSCICPSFCTFRTDGWKVRRGKLRLKSIVLLFDKKLSFDKALCVRCALTLMMLLLTFF